MTEKDLLASRQSVIQKLTQARLEKGLSQAQLARLIGTQRSNICRIESGAQNLSLDMMIRDCRSARQGFEYPIGRKESDNDQHLFPSPL